MREDISHASQGSSKVQHTIMLSRSEYVVREVCLGQHMSCVALMISEAQYLCPVGFSMQL